MDSKYDHREHEEKIYKNWENTGAFKPIQKSKVKSPFSIVLPPPNANAALHYGHAMYTVEDVLIRYHRMIGDSTVWIPGADHAGFETQVVYEKHLEKEGKSRFDFDRDTLYKNIWDFVQSNRGTMENQLRRLGFSLDWSKMKFTLDDDIVKTVYKTFKKLYDDGLVYRDIKLVNYCIKHGTAFSDLEVEHVEKVSKLYFVKYRIKDSKDTITVATTRPETIFGDTAIAVNPKDRRYKKFIGLFAVNPLNNREMPIISDSYVKMDFGTGALKVTPLHDENDFELGKKHGLEKIQVIDLKGKLTKEAGKFEGQKAVTAREDIVEKLKNDGYLEKVEEFTNSVGICYKCANILEPLPMEQWFIRTKELAIPAIEAVKRSQTKIIPKRFEKIYFNWLENIRDWNVSRQIVWGIRIPAWKNKTTGEWVVTDGIAPEGSDWVQDTDTFDTWFSSGQWPFATLGFPNGKDYKKFYPLDIMETGYDILFFWVARMMMLGLYITKKVPFKTVYLHGIVKDSRGQKMSKSKGNVINPLETVEKYGADALRMSLIQGAGAGNDQNYSEEKIKGMRNFANKIWNATRFVKQNEKTQEIKEFKNKNYNLKLKTIINKTTKYMEQYKLNQAAEVVYNEFWHWYCDKCIEDAKHDKLLQQDLKYGLKIFLKLLHPFMPFVTEACWKELGNNTLLTTSTWPNMNSGKKEKG
jgi:valyl-tRNA synthetase